MNTFKLAAAVVIVSSAASAQVFTRSFSINTVNGAPTGLEGLPNGDLVYTSIGGMSGGTVGRADINGAIAFSADISANTGRPIGITSDGVANVWVTDVFADEVDLYSGALTYISSFSVAAFTGFPEGITLSSVTGNLYVTDGINSQVFEFTTAGTHLNTFPLNGFSIDGIAHDPSDNTFWVYDSGTDSIRHYTANFVQLSAAPGTIALGLGNGEGVAVIGTDIYVSANSVAVFSTTAVFGNTISYGQGCPQSGPGLPLTLSASTRPVIGTNFLLQTTNIPPLAVSGGTILGLLPLNLTLPILPAGCTILSSGDLTTLPLSLGTGSNSIALPNNPALSGFVIFAQSIVLDLAQASVVPAVFSNGLLITIGDV